MFTGRAEPPKEFRGPWCLSEVLQEEFAALDLRPATPAIAHWEIASSDIVDPTRTSARLRELQFYGELATRITRVPFNARQAVRAQLAKLLPLSDELSQGVMVAREEEVLRDKPPEYTFNRALALEPSALVKLCAPLLQSDRGKTLARNVPDVTRMQTAEAEDTRRRFNRTVLETAFQGLIRSVDDRDCASLFKELADKEATTPKGQDRGYRWALALSGGGIRSASFSLGALQALASGGYLRRFDYLSTVSGGGYIGSWLSAWISREASETVLDQLSQPSVNPFDSEAAPIRHLRLYSRYLNPHRGIFTPDMWTLIATVLRNMVLNWLVILPCLAAVLAVPLLAASVVGHPPFNDLMIGVGIPLLAAAGFVCATTGVWFIHSHRPGSDEDATETRMPSSIRALTYLMTHSGERAFLLFCLFPLSAASIILNTLWYWLAIPRLGAQFPIIRDSWSLPWLGSVNGGVAVAAAFGLAVHVLGWSIAGSQVPRNASNRMRRVIREFVMVAAAGLAAGLVVCGLAFGIRALSHNLVSFLNDNLAAYTAAVGASSDAVVYSILAFPGFIAALVLANFLYVGLSSQRSDEEREWSARYTAWLLMTGTAWILFAGIVAASSWVLKSGMGYVISSLGAGLGGFTALLGHSPSSGGKQPATEAKNGRGGIMGLAARLGVAVMAPLAVAVIAMALAVADLSLLIRMTSRFDLPPVTRVIVYGISLLVFSFLVSLFIDVNKFSLHAMYRARLIRAYLGASRPAGTRHSNPFTGFDPDDNVPIRSVLDPQAGSRPIHIVNVALNLTGGSNLGWQDRQARSFTVSPLHAGARGVGYRRTRFKQSRDECYGGTEGISLGTAMAISGAAASPNMGYHSSKPVTFLMTIFNARLGWWLGNPGWSGHANFHDANPNTRLSPIFAELLGFTRDSDPLVYLSDGGHFENLGLYEMVVRRCRLIVVVDASGDPAYKFDDLGNAISRIRIDLGISIVFDSLSGIRGRREDGAFDSSGMHGTTARILYSEVDRGSADGLLVYVKPALNGDEPVDVLAYARTSPTFPHESTAEQSYSEQRLEAYRALGRHSVEEVLHGGVDTRLNAQLTTGAPFFYSAGQT